MKQVYQTLLIENRKSDFIITKDILQDINVGFELHRVADYYKGLEAFTSGKYDLCLLDYHLSDEFSSIKFLEDSAAKFSMTPVVVLTLEGDRNIDLQVMSAGASDYIVKGQINAPLLERTVRYAIERKRNQQQLMDLQDELTMALREIRENQKALIEVENLKSVRELAGAAAHEFSQPLQCLTNYISLIREGLPAEKYLDKMEKSIQRIAGLTDNLRDITGLKKRAYVDTHIIDLKASTGIKELSRVLLVDDEPEIVETLSDMLEIKGIETDGVTDGFQALELLQQNRYSLIISDVSMPKISGPDFFKRVREAGITTPFIFITGYEVSNDVHEVVESADALINKPIAFDALFRQLEELELTA
ncbi:MAG TPA: response regulator [Caldithrix abyssi]|uniref:histidine kinase n=1 Tax=Caldithrix abyssi TaxID=187145 RepID=A0A7V5RPR2_CALAY|nr:response regulator [Caldithrix abyssi]